MYWSGKRDSNSRPRPWQGRALPTELLPHEKFLWKFFMRRFFAAPRHNESKLSFCSRLAKKLPPCVWNRYHVFLNASMKHFQIISMNFGEENETRTHTTLLSLPPQSSASTNSAISPVKCPEQDSNLHASRHTHLKRARLPIPPPGHFQNKSKIYFLSGKRDSNSRPRPWQGRALPTELLPQIKFLWNLICGEGLRRLGIVKENFPFALGLCDHCLCAFGIVFTYSNNAGANHFQKNYCQRVCFRVKAVQR